MTKLVMLLLFALLGTFVNAQESKNLVYTKLVIDQQLSPQEEIEINQSIKDLGEFFIARMDKNTFIFLGVYHSSPTLNESKIQEWFINRGITVRCFFTENYVEGKMKIINKDNCQ
jgi:hypothetical protein